MRKEIGSFKNSGVGGRGISPGAAKIAVLIPCHNEEVTIGKVIDDFRRELSAAEIYVVDNCSTDKTAAVALERDAIVLKEPRKGKGFAVERMFEDIDADIYVMVDGDDTYPAGAVKKLIEPIVNCDADMVVGARLSNFSGESFRPLHVFGNNLVRKLVNWIGEARLTDIMSGYRAFNRRVVQKIPLVSSGFEVETDMTIQLLYYRMKIVEVQVEYKGRPAGSKSKLNTFSDGLRVLSRIFSLFRAFKPLTFFGGFAAFFFVAGLAAGFIPIRDYIVNQNHYITHVPLAILATGLMALSAGCLFLGILLHVLNSRFRELHNVLTRRSL